MIIEESDIEKFISSRSIGSMDTSNNGLNFVCFWKHVVLIDGEERVIYETVPMTTMISELGHRVSLPVTSFSPRILYDDRPDMQYDWEEDNESQT